MAGKQKSDKEGVKRTMPASSVQGSETKGPVQGLRAKSVPEVGSQIWGPRSRSRSKSEGQDPRSGVRDRGPGGRNRDLKVPEGQIWGPERVPEGRDQVSRQDRQDLRTGQQEPGYKRDLKTQDDQTGQTGGQVSTRLC